MIRGAGDTAVANGTGTPEPSAPSTSGASLSLAPDPAAAPEPPPTLTSPPAPSPRRVTSQRQPPTTSNPGSSSYVRDPSGNPGASWPVPQPQPLPVTQPHFHRGVSTMSRGRGGGVVEGTEIGLVVRDMLHVGSKVIRGVKSGMHALTQRDREHGTPLGPDVSPRGGGCIFFFPPFFFVSLNRLFFRNSHGYSGNDRPNVFHSFQSLRLKTFKKNYTK